MKHTQFCNIKIYHLLLLFYLVCVTFVYAVPSADDLIYQISPELETLAEIENDTYSEPFIFKYENFLLDYTVACRIGSNVTFATRNPNTGKLQSVDDDRYDVVGGDIGADGEFQIALRGNINEQDGNCLVCGYATTGFVMETSCIRLRITKKPVYYLEQRPSIAVTGDEVEIYCIVSGYPFPQVQFSPPYYLPVETRLMSLPNETLRVVKYVSTIDYIDVSWNEEEVKCKVHNDDTTYKEKVMKVFVKKYNESIVFDDQTVSTIAVVCSIFGVFLMVSMMLGLVLYMKKKGRKEAYYCMKINDCDDNDNDQYPNYNINKKPPVYPIKTGPSYPPNYKQPPPGILKNTHPPQHPQKQNACYPPTMHAPPPKQNSCYPPTVHAPPPQANPCYPTPITQPKIHYYPQQIINVTQKHSHHKPSNGEKKCDTDKKKEVTCKTVTTNTECAPVIKKEVIKKEVVNKGARQCETSKKHCDQKQTTNECTNTKLGKLNVSTSAFV